jgi:hypothetical protein
MWVPAAPHFEITAATTPSASMLRRAVAKIDDDGTLVLDFTQVAIGQQGLDELLPGKDRPEAHVAEGVRLDAQGEHKAVHLVDWRREPRVQTDAVRNSLVSRTRTSSQPRSAPSGGSVRRCSSARSSELPFAICGIPGASPRHASFGCGVSAAKRSNAGGANNTKSPASSGALFNGLAGVWQRFEPYPQIVRQDDGAPALLLGLEITAADRLAN